MIYWISFSFWFGVFLVAPLDGSLLVAEVSLLFFIVDLVFLKLVPWEAMTSIIT